MRLLRVPGYLTRLILKIKRELVSLALDGFKLESLTNSELQSPIYPEGPGKRSTKVEPDYGKVIEELVKDKDMATGGYFE